MLTDNARKVFGYTGAWKDKDITFLVTVPATDPREAVRRFNELDFAVKNPAGLRRTVMIDASTSCPCIARRPTGDWGDLSDITNPAENN